MKKLTILDALPMVRAYQAKDGNSVGGSLHIVLADGNIDAGSVKWCIQHALERKDYDGLALGRALARMSDTQRRKLHRLFYTPHSSEVAE